MFEKCDSQTTCLRTTGGACSLKMGFPPPPPQTRWIRKSGVESQKAFGKIMRGFYAHQIWDEVVTKLISQLGLKEPISCTGCFVLSPPQVHLNFWTKFLQLRNPREENAPFRNTPLSSLPTFLGQHGQRPDLTCLVGEARKCLEILAAVSMKRKVALLLSAHFFQEYWPQ